MQPKHIREVIQEQEDAILATLYELAHKYSEWCSLSYDFIQYAIGERLQVPQAQWVPIIENARIVYEYQHDYPHCQTYGELEARRYLARLLPRFVLHFGLSYDKTRTMYLDLQPLNRVCETDIEIDNAFINKNRYAREIRRCYRVDGELHKLYHYRPIHAYYSARYYRLRKSTKFYTIQR